MDILSFEKMELSPDLEEEYEYYTKGRAIAVIYINGLPLIDILEPLLKKAANGAGYIHATERYIYIAARKLYDELIKLLDKETSSGDKVLNVILRKGLYDACAPNYIRIDSYHGTVIWKSYCYYNYYYKEAELPVFLFDTKQYKKALEQLKSLM